MRIYHNERTSKPREAPKKDVSIGHLRWCSAIALMEISGFCARCADLLLKDTHEISVTCVPKKGINKSNEINS